LKEFVIRNEVDDIDTCKRNTDCDFYVKFMRSNFQKKKMRCFWWRFCNGFTNH